ncbi:MAG: type II 3-dehydroquinate dehydratase [Solirubrobacterales bacterium]
MKQRVHVLHGVNLNKLGHREPEHYGSLTLNGLEHKITGWAAELGIEVSFFQTNHEGRMVEELHRLGEGADGAILNAGAWTHYAYSLRDALEAGGCPCVEVHLSDVQAREPWRRQSVFEGLVLGVVSGKHEEGYREALQLLRTEFDA